MNLNSQAQQQNVTNPPTLDLEEIVEEDKIAPPGGFGGGEAEVRRTQTFC
jgi:hypothetical protein